MTWQGVLNRVKTLEASHRGFMERTRKHLKRQDEMALREIQGRDEEIRQLNERVEILERNRESQGLAVATLIDEVARLKAERRAPVVECQHQWQQDVDELTNTLSGVYECRWCGKVKA